MIHDTGSKIVVKWPLKRAVLLTLIRIDGDKNKKKCQIFAAQE